MVCVECLQASRAGNGTCPFCGAPDYKILLGFDPLDLLNPYELGRKTAPTVQEIDVNNIPGPGDLLSSVLKVPGAIADSIGSLTSTVKWIVLGGAALAGTAFAYSVYQSWKHDLPGMAFREIAREREAQRGLGKEIAKGALKYSS